MKREPIDLHAVRDEHIKIHERLVNWARCQRGGRGRLSSCLPMFRFYRSGYQESGSGTEPPDEIDGGKIQEAFATLPEKHRHAIGWSYVKSWIPLKIVFRELGVNRAGLMGLIHDGRSMINNKLRR